MSNPKLTPSVIAAKCGTSATTRTPAEGLLRVCQPLNATPAAVSPSTCNIRWMIRRDMDEVLDIENQTFEFPWLDEDFLRVLRQRNCIGMVAEHECRVAGFMIYELHKTCIRVLNFSVAPDYQRRGVGSQMVAKLIAEFSTQRRSRIVLEVRETNLAAQLFFRENGFRAVSVLRSFYEDAPEDAYLMQYRFRWNERFPGSDKVAAPTAVARCAEEIPTASPGRREAPPDR
jgi:[ribosomal protein S18]-alanine N-acetyltransferase